MNVKNDISIELQEMGSTLAGVTRAMPFPVPNDYFAEFAEGLINKIDQASNNWVKEEAYTVPDGYFESLPQAILTEAVTEERSRALPKAGTYQTPPGYFDTLPEDILQKAKANEIQRTIIIKWQSAVKWAAAAILVLGIALGTYLKTGTEKPDTSKALAALPAGTLNEYVAQNVDDFETELILNNLTAGKTINTRAQLNEQEIIQYLNEEGWDVKTEIN